MNAEDNNPMDADVHPGQDSDEELLRRRRRRSVALAIVLGAVVVLFYAISLVKGPAILNRPI